MPQREKGRKETLEWLFGQVGMRLSIDEDRSPPRGNR